LTTAATIWLAAAIGVAAGFGYVLLGGLCVAFGLLTLVAFEVVEQRLFPDNAADSYPTDSDDAGESRSSKSPSSNSPSSEESK